MPRPLNSSRQTFAVLTLLAHGASRWHYGLQIAKETGLRSGTLYPILIRLAERGLVESQWLAPQKPGLPSRHAYRITAEGLALLSRSPPVAARGPRPKPA